jgi:secreted Zn-dependent insulinase-like peptidase
VHEECRELGKIKFDYLDKGSAINYCVSLSSTMQRFEKVEDLPHLLRHRYVADDFNKDRIQEMQTLIADPKNSQIYLRSKSFDDSILTIDQYWYKFKYSSEKYSNELLDKLVKPVVVDNGKKLDLPPLNKLLPTNFDILPEDAKLSHQPQLLQAWEDTEVWFMKDDEFKRPKGIVNLKLYSNEKSAKTPEGRLFLEVWNECLTEYRREFCYMADLANLSFDHSLGASDVKFKWAGYNTSLPNFIDATVQII